MKDISNKVRVSSWIEEKSLIPISLQGTNHTKILKEVFVQYGRVSNVDRVQTLQSDYFTTFVTLFFW